MPKLPIEAHPAGESLLIKKKTCLALENTKIPVSTFNGLVPFPFSFDRLACHKPCPVSL